MCLALSGPVVSEFRQKFREVVEHYLKDLACPAILECSEDRDLLVIPGQRSGGFEAQLECMDYGVYPSVAGWHGGCWDVTIWEIESLGPSLIEFIESVLNDAVLAIHYSNGKAYKWVLNHNFEGQRVSDETGLIFYNWFGEKTVKTFSNAKAT